MSYIGRTPTPAALTASDITDGIVSEAKMANDAISLAELKAGTDGNIISYDTSGNPVAVATGTDGQVLTSSGAGAVCAFETIAAGITNADMWRMHTTLTGVTSMSDITANWERSDSTGQGTGMQIGTGVTESSGIFTFPQTGIWKIDAYWTIAAVNYNASYVQVRTMLTSDGTTYGAASRITQGLSPFDEVTSINGAIASSVLFNVDNTTNCKVKFTMQVPGSGPYLYSGTTEGYNGAVFYRLGDT